MPQQRYNLRSRCTKHLEYRLNGSASSTPATSPRLATPTPSSSSSSDEDDDNVKPRLIRRSVRGNTANGGTSPQKAAAVVDDVSDDDVSDNDDLKNQNEKVDASSNLKSKKREEGPANLDIFSNTSIYFMYFMLLVFVYSLTNPQWLNNIAKKFYYLLCSLLLWLTGPFLCGLFVCFCTIVVEHFNSRVPGKDPPLSEYIGRCAVCGVVAFVYLLSINHIFITRSMSWN